MKAAGPRTSTGWLGRIGNQSFRNLWRRRNRTLLSAAGIGVGVGTLVMLGGLMKGMIGQLNGLTGSGGAGSITVMQRDVADMSMSSLDERMVRQILAMPEVKTASPFMLAVISSPEMPMFFAWGSIPTALPCATTSWRAAICERPNEYHAPGQGAAETYKWGSAKQPQRQPLQGGGRQAAGRPTRMGGMLALREAQRLMGRPRAVSFIFVDVKPGATHLVTKINARFPEARASLSSEFAQSSNDLQTTQGMAGESGHRR